MKRITREMQKVFEGNLPQYALDYITEMVNCLEKYEKKIEKLEWENDLLKGQLFRGQGGQNNGYGSNPVGFRYNDNHYPGQYPDVYSNLRPWEDDPMPFSPYGPNFQRRGRRNDGGDTRAYYEVYGQESRPRIGRTTRETGRENPDITTERDNPRQ